MVTLTAMQVIAALPRVPLLTIEEALAVLDAHQASYGICSRRLTNPKTLCVQRSRRVQG